MAKHVRQLAEYRSQYEGTPTQPQTQLQIEDGAVVGPGDKAGAEGEKAGGEGLKREASDAKPKPKPAACNGEGSGFSWRAWKKDGKKQKKGTSPVESEADGRPAKRVKTETSGGGEAEGAAGGSGGAALRLRV